MLLVKCASYCFNKGYVDDLMARIEATLGADGGRDNVPLLTAPLPLNANFEKPRKEDAVLAHVSRFNRA